MRVLRGAALLLAASAAVALAQLGPMQPGQPQTPATPAQPQRPPLDVARNPESLRRIERPLPPPDLLNRMPTVLQMPGMQNVVVRRDIVYRTAGGKPLRFDLYLPPEKVENRPAIVFASGASDAREWGVFQSYGRLAAMNGFAGIVYEKRYERSEVLQGVADTDALFAWLRDHAREVDVDAGRMVLWAFSAGGKLMGTGIHAQRAEVRALIGFYPVLDISNELPFYPDTMRTRARLTASPSDILEARPAALPPTLIVRAGLDNPVLNAGVARFVRLALEANRPIELVNVVEGRHAFDIVDDHEDSRRAIRRAFEFAKEHTAAAAKPAR